MQSEYAVAIPSYQRAQLVWEKTVAYLARTNVDLNKVRVFVASEQEEREYLKARPLEMGAVLTVIGVPTLCAQRRFIQDYYEKHVGLSVLSMDDDVEFLGEATGPKQVREVLDLLTWLAQSKEACQAYGARVWGVAPLLNAFYLWGSQPVQHGLKFCVGACFGFLAGPDLPYQTLAAKDDYERCLQHYKQFGGVVRWSRMAPKTKYYSTGGLESFRTPATSEVEVQNLLERFPGLLRVNPKRKSEYTEILLQEPRRKRT